MGKYTVSSGQLLVNNQNISYVVKLKCGALYVLQAWSFYRCSEFVILPLQFQTRVTFCLGNIK